MVSIASHLISMAIDVWQEIGSNPTCPLSSVGILGRARKPGVGKLNWHGDFDTGFKRNIFIVRNPVCGSFEYFWNTPSTSLWLT